MEPWGKKSQHARDGAARLITFVSLFHCPLSNDLVGVMLAYSHYCHCQLSCFHRTQTWFCFAASSEKMPRKSAAAKETLSCSNNQKGELSCLRPYDTPPSSPTFLVRSWWVWQERVVRSHNPDPAVSWAAASQRWPRAQGPIQRTRNRLMSHT